MSCLILIDNPALTIPSLVLVEGYNYFLFLWDPTGAPVGDTVELIYRESEETGYVTKTALLSDGEILSDPVTPGAEYFIWISRLNATDRGPWYYFRRPAGDFLYDFSRPENSMYLAGGI